MTFAHTLVRRITKAWTFFPQLRTLHRAVALSLGLLCGMGRRTLTRSIGFHGNTQVDWSADYKLFSRCEWEPKQIFNPILQRCVLDHKLEDIVVAIDDTRLQRTGQKVPHAQWHRDPLGPPFHTNLIWAHRFLQLSVVLPLYKKDQKASPRAIPVRLDLAPSVRKPGKKASIQSLEDYRKAKKANNLSTQAVKAIVELREELNGNGHEEKLLITVGDGSFTNRTVYREPWQKKKVTIVSRVRKDAVLCKRSRRSGRIYAKTKFTPEQVRQDDKLCEWKTAKMFHGGCFREVRYKEMSPVLWQRGAQETPLRLLVIEPVAYRVTKKGRTYYRRPAYLLTNDLTSTAEKLLQAYFDRWEIEVNHRDEKEVLGVGESQVWNEDSVSKVPALMVGTYSMMLLTALECFGTQRTEEFEPLPKWRRTARRASCRDMVTLLRKQLGEKPPDFETAEEEVSHEKMVLSAAA
jgi:hypothetical protein